MASAGPSSRPSSTRAPRSGSAPATPTRSPRPRRRCSDRGSVTGTALDVGDADALAAWVEQSADGVRRARRGRRQRQRPRDPRHRGELAGQPQRRPHAHGPPGPGRDAAPRAQRRRLDHRHLQRVRARVGLRLRPVRHRQDRHRRLHPRAGAAAGRQGHPRQHRLARATPTSRAASGPASRPATRSCSRPRSGSTRPATWARPRRSPAPVVFLASPGPAGSAAPTSSSTAR